MKSIEQKYRKLSDIDHCLTRPGMYVGSIKPREEEVYLPVGSGPFEKRKITYNPAFLKIFDEIVSNSVDEHRRNPKLNEIRVTVDQEKREVTIWDNGGIPVLKHSEHNEWVPELIFSNLKAGSNFNDDEERLVAGTNGVGSTLTNIFSHKFRIRTADGKNAFQQTFSSNMRERTEAKILPWKESFTEISYEPDLERFGMTEIDGFHIDMMRRRCIDLAACNSNLKISFNGDNYKFKSFKDYCNLYTPNVIFEDSERWMIGIAPSEGSFTQVSFVNAVETKDGGTHVDYIASQVIDYVRERVKKKHKVDLKPAELKNHFFLFVRADIVNPSFASQTKEKLITEARDFGSKFEIPEKTLKAVATSEIVQRILDWAQQKALAEERKQLRELNKNLAKGKVLKLIDAKARYSRGSCTLALFEGDCLDNNTEVKVFRSDSGATSVKVKDIQVGDHVITHANRLREVIAKSSKISKLYNVKTKEGIISASGSHRMWIYDTSERTFKFVRIDEIVPGQHRMVKSKLSTSCMFVRIIKIHQHDNNILVACDDDVIIATPSHKFAILDIEDQEFKMINASGLIAERHYIVLNSVS